MTYTSAEANKLLKSLYQQERDLLEKEEKASTFVAAMEEDLEAIRPAYDFSEAQKQLEEVRGKIRAVKHAISVFNLTHEVPDTGMTVDQVLLYIPQLTAQRDKLQTMQSRLPRERKNDYGASNFIEYTIANYDVAEAQRAYQETADKLAKVQLALDKLNTTETMEIDL